MEKNSNLGRRNFLRALGAQGIALPAFYFLSANASRAQAGSPGRGLAAPARSGPGGIVRHFAEPYLELLRLLRQASEIEHALMVQYLYAATSLKPAYTRIAGFGAAGSDSVVGIAVMEMQHLRQVNDLLGELGGAPVLTRQDFPFDPEVYPFPFTLESISRDSLAKYVYCEAAAGTLDPRAAADAPERRFHALLRASLGTRVKPNHVGTLYDAVIELLGEYIATQGARGEALQPWLKKLETIKADGEVGHFQFFKRLFTAEHDELRRRGDAWLLPRSDRAYPAIALPANPTGILGRDNQIGDPAALGLAWLGNLHYWTILLLADLAYSDRSEDFAGLSRTQMLGPFWSIARHLPTLGAGMPFDPLGTGYSPCRDTAHQLEFLECMVSETIRYARRLEKHLPGDYSLAITEYTLSALREKRSAYARA